MQHFILLCSLLALVCVGTGAWQSNDKVLLKDVDVLTLYSGRMTTGRRSAPVPQLNCVGGAASGSFVPQVVQCSNRGSDGVDVQWECKADMDNEYRFGKVEVLCEGYDYPDDPYILKGSCGLDYTLEFTKEGHQKRQNHYSGSGHQKSYSFNYNSKKSSWLGDVVMMVIVGVIIYAVYRTCMARSEQETGDWHDGNRSQRRPPASAPPPPGFRDEYMPGPGDDSCHSTRSTHNSRTHTTPGASQGGGFWTGAATGGILGYLFGSRTNTGYGTHYQQPHYGRRYGGGGWGSGWGSSGGSSWGSGSFGGGGGGGMSSGTRTASGFGGTRRR